MSPITTHILDLDTGLPAADVLVTLLKEEKGSWQELSTAKTDSDGRIKTLLTPGALTPGYYKLVFSVGEYFSIRGKKSFYKSVPVEFSIDVVDRHFHVPLLISPFGYSTYRGS
jgi:5-hydroxyisourate hydrolase